ncbi:MAG: hypothetical protein JJT99_00750 [Rhodobacteraceae bacterium]|nr:hypothetical protein [Paracoccaceae bacterium]
MYEDFSERLFAHYVGGAWRAPFGTKAASVVTRDGQMLGQVIAAECRDVSRALAGLREAGDGARRDFAALVAQQAEDLAEGLAAQGARPSTSAILHFAAALAGQEPVAAPVALIRPARDDLSVLGQALGRGLGAGVIHCPPVSEAIFATQLARCAAQAGLPAGAFTLLHCPTAAAQKLLRHSGITVQ